MRQCDKAGGMAPCACLRHSGEHLLYADDLGDVLGHVQALQAGQSEQRGLAGALLQLPQPRLHVPSEVLHLRSKGVGRWEVVQSRVRHAAGWVTMVGESERVGVGEDAMV